MQIDIELSDPARISNAIVSPHGCSKVTFGCISSFYNISCLAINDMKCDQISHSIPSIVERGLRQTS